MNIQIKLAVRNFLKRPIISLIKILGLSLALSGVLFIILFIKNELSYDRFHEKHENIYRFSITSPGFFGGNHFARVYQPGYIQKMAEYFPGIENFVRLIPIRGGTIKYDGNYLQINEAFQCDSTFFKVFDVELLSGNPENVLDNPGSLVVSEDFAQRVFGDDNPMGQIITLPEGQYYGKSNDFAVCGVMKSFPQNSHFHPEFLINPLDRSEFNSWAWTYFLLKAKAKPENIVEGFTKFYAMHKKVSTENIVTQAHLQNIADIHLHSNKFREIETNSNINIIYSLSITAIILLLIAFTNYTSLNIGMSRYSVKYLFVSNVLGSSRWMHLKFFLIENIIIYIATLFVSLIIVKSVHNKVQVNFAIDLLSGNLLWIILLFMLFGVIGVISSITPIFKYVIINIKSNVRLQNKKGLQNQGLSKGLMVFQYSIAMILVVAVIVIKCQTDYAIKNSMGSSSRDNLICFKNVHSNVQKKFPLFKEELLKYSSIESVSAMFEPPGGEANDKFYFEMEDYVSEATEESSKMIGMFPCDYSFASIFQLNFLSGINFTETNIDNEGSGEYIINESAMRKLNFSDPNEIIGKNFRFIQNYKEIPSGRIIGVVADFHLSTITKKTKPLVLYKSDDLWLINFVVLFRPNMKKEALSDLEKVWLKMFPEYPFNYSYVDSMYESIYRTELLQSKLLSVFTFMALFICSMGLLGLSLLVTQYRTKEIGIRKVNGAKIIETTMMLNFEFIKWILLSFLIAIPISTIAMSKWLEGYAYNISLSWWMYLFAGLIIILISLITVSFNSYKIARQNPVKALRYE